MVNPEQPISSQASSIHGITDERVAGEPTFKDLAPEIAAVIQGADLGGYNSTRFDVPFLAEAFLRVGLDFDPAQYALIDAQVIFFKKEPRDLSAAYRFYCDSELVEAHSAKADTLATFEILNAQVAHYEDLEGDLAFLSDYTRPQKTADLAGFIGLDESGAEIFSFGKYKGQRVAEVFERDKGYFGWIQNADFPLYTKRVIAAIKMRKSNS